MARPRSDRLSAPRVLGHIVVMVAVAAVLGLVVAGLAIPFAGVLGIGATQVASGMTGLPAELKTEPLAQRTIMVDADGNVIATLYDENRINVSLSQISRTMVKSIVAIEDYRFYQHGALDLKGTLRALITNQANSGVVQGGSSITQQLVKLTLLDQAKGTKKQRRGATDDTYARKLRELRYAIALRAALLQGLDPRALPQHSPTSATAPTASRRPPGTTSTSTPSDLNLRPVRPAGRPGEEPDRLRPDQLPRPGPRAPRRRPRPDGPAQRDHRRQGRAAEEARPRPPRRRTTQRLRLLAGAVLLRLRRSTTSCHDPSLGETVQERKNAAQRRRPDDQDHDRPARPGAPPTTSVADHVHPTDQAIGGARDGRAAAPAT